MSEHVSSRDSSTSSPSFPSIPSSTSSSILNEKNKENSFLKENSSNDSVDYSSELFEAEDLEDFLGNMNPDDFEIDKIDKNDQVDIHEQSSKKAPEKSTAPQQSELKDAPKKEKFPNWTLTTQHGFHLSDHKAMKLIEHGPSTLEWKEAISLYAALVKQLRIPAIDQELYYITALKERRENSFLKLLNIIRSLEEHKKRTFLVMKMILERESIFKRLINLENLLKRGEISKLEAESEGITLLQCLQLTSLKCVELIVFWRHILSRPWPYKTTIHHKRYSEVGNDSQTNQSFITSQSQFFDSNTDKDKKTELPRLSFNYLEQLNLDAQWFEGSFLNFILPTKNLSNIPLMSPFVALGSGKLGDKNRIPNELSEDTTAFTHRLMKAENIIMNEEYIQASLQLHLKHLLRKGLFVPILNTPHIIESCIEGIPIDNRFSARYQSVLQSLQQEKIEEEIESKFMAQVDKQLVENISKYNYESMQSTERFHPPVKKKNQSALKRRISKSAPLSKSRKNGSSKETYQHSKHQDNTFKPIKRTESNIEAKRSIESPLKKAKLNPRKSSAPHSTIQKTHSKNDIIRNEELDSIHHESDSGSVKERDEDQSARDNSRMYIPPSDIQVFTIPTHLQRSMRPESRSSPRSPVHRIESQDSPFHLH